MGEDKAITVLDSYASTVIELIVQSAWTPLFGMLTDRFGVIWVMDMAAPYNPP